MPRFCLHAAAAAALLGVASGAAGPQTPPPAPAVTPAAAPLTLETATAAALAYNPAARAAAQQLAQAQARVGQAEAQRRFQITFNSTVSGSDAAVYQPPPSHETFGTLQNTITVPVPLGSRPRLAVTQARQQLAAAQAQYQSARFVLAGQVSAAYFDLLRRQALLAVAQDNEAQAQRALTETQRRNRAGDVARLDVLRAQVPLASAQAARYAAETALATARQALNGLLRRPLDGPVTVADVGALPTALPYTVEQARARALARSPDIRAADATVAADEAALEAARLYREPTLSLQAIDLRSKDVTSFSREDTLQASVTLPLADGGLGREQVKEAEAALAQAQAQAESARQTALVNVSTAFLDAQSSQRQVAAARAVRDIAQASYDKTVQGYQAGLFPFTDVLTAQAALTQARLAYTQAVYDAATALNALQAAVNGGAAVGAAPNAPTPSPGGPSGNTTGPDTAQTNATGTPAAGHQSTGNTSTGKGTP